MCLGAQGPVNLVESCPTSRASANRLVLCRQKPGSLPWRTLAPLGTHCYSWACVAQKVTAALQRSRSSVLPAGAQATAEVMPSHCCPSLCRSQEVSKPPPATRPARQRLECSQTARCAPAAVTASSHVTSDPRCARAWLACQTAFSFSVCMLFANKPERNLLDPPTHPNSSHTTPLTVSSKPRTQYSLPTWRTRNPVTPSPQPQATKKTKVNYKSVKCRAYTDLQ